MGVGQLPPPPDDPPRGRRGLTHSATRSTQVGASLLSFFSRWWQIESLYRANAKYRPIWEPRYM
ncbi:phosphatidylglycerol lysyltransferase domain-containing protein, partial [Streptomyces decoyicus]